MPRETLSVKILGAQLPRCLSECVHVVFCFGVMELWKLCGKDPVFARVMFS